MDKASFVNIGCKITFYEENPSQYWSYFFVKDFLIMPHPFLRVGHFVEAAAILKLMEFALNLKMALHAIFFVILSFGGWLYLTPQAPPRALK